MDRTLVPLRVLLVEDAEDDALLVLLELRRGGYQVESRRVESPDALREALRQAWDVVVSDYALPGFDGLAALSIVRSVAGDELPFVLVSGTIGEERAVEALKSGAGDFVTKQNLSRLVPAIDREIRDAQVRRERRETLEALQKAVAARDRFISIASHELRTPLTSLQLQVQSLERAVQDGRAEPERLAAKLRNVSRSTQRLGELVARLLDVSSIRDEQLALVRERFDLRELTREVVSRFEEPLRDAGSPLELIAPDPLVGWWDRLRVEAVLTNLLSNAVKYGAGRPIEVRLGHASEIARLAVTDHGIGIAESDQARIFERFERAVPERHYGGFGIGLWVARLVAEAHGGTLQVRSEPGEGSTFVLQLPLRDDRR